MKKIFLFLSFLGISITTYALTNEAAFEIAKDQLAQKNRPEVISFYGKGDLKEIRTWYIKFYTPETKSKASVVVVENGKAKHPYPTEDAKPQEAFMAFEPALFKATVESALKTAEKYASESQLPCDVTRVYLNRPGKDQAPVWTIELIKDKKSQGYIYANATSGDFAGYRPPAPQTKKGFSQEVKDTFLEMGGDLEEFFTGKRTVDKE